MAFDAEGVSDMCLGSCESCALCGLIVGDLESFGVDIIPVCGQTSSLRAQLVGLSINRDELEEPQLRARGSFKLAEVA